MQLSRLAQFALPGLLCFSLSGCLLSHSNHMVLRQDEPLRQLTFESESSRNAYESQAQLALDDESNVSRASFGIPFIVGMQQSKKISKAGIRNDVAKQLDINGDDHISNYEISLMKK